eukprot:TRINITY_DN109199_c0_g1_i1.p1 TRINITY_DN109199_c0_g1~~TRINITY_DN109199_c0_g1_i1.p1  ORF type:complete len:486 (-),score=69.70 TRINITY_DN109199_c0_g1_i1:292-1749(-)
MPIESGDAENLLGRSDSNDNSIAVDEVLDRISLGPWHTKLLLFCGLGFSAAALEVVLTGFLMMELHRAWSLTHVELAFLPMLAGCGSILGSLVWGPVADRYGRRPTFITSSAVVFVFGMASACVPSLPWLIFTRFFTSFGIGGNIAVDFTIYSELLPTRGRGGMLFKMQAFWPVGQVLGCILAWVVIPNFGWRAYLVVSAVPSLLAAVTRPCIPESPRWLLLNGCQEEAKSVCKDIARANGKEPEDVGLTDDVQLRVKVDVSQLRKESNQWTVTAFKIFREPLLKTSLGVIIYSLCLNIMTYGMFTLMPTLLKQKGFKKDDTYMTMTLNSLAQFPGVFGVGLAATHFGRLLPLRTALFFPTIAFGLLGAAQNDTTVMIAGGIGSMFLEASWAMFHTYMPEVYPTELRATAIGTLTALATTLSQGLPLIVGYLLKTQTLAVVISFFCITSAVGSLGVFCLLSVETKHRDLEDAVCETSDSDSPKSR